MSPYWVVRTGRLLLRPVSFADLAELIALKCDPRVFAIMLGGVRTPERTAQELAEDIAFWGAHGVGMWAARDAVEDHFLGYVGLHNRRDHDAIALRFAFTAGAQGRGYASEAAGAALSFGHEQGKLDRIIAIARASNIASRQVLGAIGMMECTAFDRGGDRVLMFESRR